MTYRLWNRDVTLPQYAGVTTPQRERPYGDGTQRQKGHAKSKCVGHDATEQQVQLSIRMDEELFLMSALTQSVY